MLPKSIDENIGYLQSVRPQIDRLVKACKDAGIPMFATFQASEYDFESFSVNHELSQWDKLKHMRWLNETWSFDAMIERAMKEGLKDGHRSVFLRCMGIPYGDQAEKMAESPVIRIPKEKERQK